MIEKKTLCLSNMPADNDKSSTQRSSAEFSKATNDQRMVRCTASSRQ
jgi:hypothetical protein